MKPSTPISTLLVAAALLSIHTPATADTVQILVNHGDFVVLSDVPGMGTPHATIQAGDTVWWSWIGFNHSVTADDGSFNSGVHSPPFNFLHTFDQPGVFRYYCTLHGAPGGIGMSGTITVVGGSCPADWNDDDQVNSSDISAFLTSWLDSVQNGNLNADFNSDNAVNSTDISAFLTAWLEAVEGGC